MPAPGAVFDPVAWWAALDGSRTALIDGATRERVSYAVLHRLADAWHAALSGAGVGHGERVAMLAHNRVEHVALFVACCRLGAVLVPLNWRLAPVELARVLRHAGPLLVIGESTFRALYDDALQCLDQQATCRWLDADSASSAARQRADLPPASSSLTATPTLPPRSPEDIAMLLYTSGSTGAPKGVMLSHRQLLWNAIGTTAGWQLTARDVGAAATPMFHTGGWHVFATTLLWVGGAVLIVPRFDPHTFMVQLADAAVSVVFVVPTQLAMLTAAPDWGAPLPALRWFFAGGAPCPPRIEHAVRAAGYDFREGYGLTECGPNCFAITSDEALAHPGVMGTPLPYLDARVRTADGGIAGSDTVGELELRGPQLFSGYFRDEARTAGCFTADGFFRTGDLASCDARGRYRIRGRLKEMFISGGENVYPGEVEAALLSCPGVAEVVVIGVPDAQWGEVGCALVVPADPSLDVARVEAFARTQLAGYKVPRTVVMVEALPRTGSGKVDRLAAARHLPSLSGDRERRRASAGAAPATSPAFDGT